MMKRKNRLTALLLACFMLTALMVNGLGLSRTAGAVTQSEIDALQEKANSLAAQQVDIRNQIASLEADQNATLEKKKALDEQVMLTQQEIDNIQAQIEAYEELIVEKEAEVVAAQKKEDEQLQRYRDRVQAMEENGSISYLAVLFDATSFSDFLSRLDFIHEVMEYDEQLYQDYIAAKEATIAAKEALEEAKAEREAAKAEEEAKKAELEEQVAAAQAYVEELQSNINTKEAYFAEINRAEDELNAEIKRMEQQLAAEEEARRKAEEEARRKAAEEEKRRQEAAAAQNSQSSSNGSSGGSSSGSGSTGSVSGTGSMTWPIPGYSSISDNYGYRTHPISGEWRLHAGIDIGASYGAPIVAADSGTVTASYYHWSYGNMIMISHGNGTSTLYAHMSSLAVSTGMTVSKGQTIGYAGSTGQSTGPHLHFEVRVNGSSVSPWGYV